jgi:hypothetical protein
MTTLTDVIDEIWQSERSRQDVALEQIPNMDDKALLSVVAIDVCTFHHFNPIKASYDAATTAMLVDLFKSEKLLEIRRDLKKSPVSPEECLFSYSDVDLDFTVRLQGAAPYEINSSQNTLSNLLAAIQVSRDHVDSLLYQPAHMRDQRLHEFASEFRMSMNQFTQLASTSRALLNIFK